jgi:hypothetical protein
MAKPATTVAIHKPRHTGSIRYPGLVFETIKKGVVLVNGSSPNAKVSVLSFDGGKKGVTTDVLQHCTITEDKGKLVISGQSARAINELKLRNGDDIVQIEVTLKHCADCGYA